MGKNTIKHVRGSITLWLSDAPYVEAREFPRRNGVGLKTRNYWTFVRTRRFERFQGCPTVLSIRNRSKYILDHFYANKNTLT